MATAVLTCCWRRRIMNHGSIARVVLALVWAAGIAVGAEGGQLVLAPTPEQIDEAVQLAVDERAAQRFLAAFVVQSHAGWGNGPLIGMFSTPFSRVVAAAAAARKRNEPFGRSNVPPDVTVSELHIVVFSVAAVGDGALATVETVRVRPRTGPHSDDDIQPIRVEDLLEPYRKLYNVGVEGRGIIAVFPLSAVSAKNEIVVVFDRTVRGASALSQCKECVVPFPSSGIR